MGKKSNGNGNSGGILFCSSEEGSSISKCLLGFCNLLFVHPLRDLILTFCLCSLSLVFLFIFPSHGHFKVTLSGTHSGVACDVSIHVDIVQYAIGSNKSISWNVYQL